MTRRADDLQLGLASADRLVAEQNTARGRRLEIGPGRARIPGFETLDVVPGRHVDHVADARTLPLEDGAFDLIYASHVIEHVPWYQTVDTLREWRRVLAPGGEIEIWTVDAAKVAHAILAAERDPDFDATQCDGWTRYNPDRNPFLWAAGRMFAYSKRGRADDPNWHRALFTPRWLRSALELAGFVDIARLSDGAERGKSHGFVTLGMGGRNPNGRRT